VRAVNEEVSLLIKSRYPVIYLETVDEIYSMRQLKQIASQLDLSLYQWSVTDGLKRADKDHSYYQTKEPIKMLPMIQALLKPREYEEMKPGLFVLKDFDKYLEDVLVLRLFKDTVNLIKGTRDTFVIVSAEYRLPKDIQSDSAHLIGGYPIEDEIKAVIEETAQELKRTNKKVTLSLSNEEMNKVTNALKGLSIQQIRNVINQCLLADNVLDIEDLSAIETYKRKIFDQEGLLEFCLTEDKDNIAGFNSLKRWLAERQDSFSEQKTASLPIPKGLLLMGVQGCGKSLAIKVIARELNLPLYRLDLAKLYSKYIGETEKNLRTALMIAEKLAPACIWIDEIEKGFAASGGDVDGGVSQRILGTFLTWMQERKANCFIATTANDVYRLSPEFLRKGRFDEIFFVDLPDAESRERILKIHLKKRGLELEDFDLREIVDATAGFSGAEIEQAIVSALYRASTEKEVTSTKHIIEQIESTRPLSILKKEEISALRAWAKERTIPA
jgi:SpoVK/Ycf46/Vps4 family AAA+-type ATPase